jgi:hypothetical protein
VFSDYCQPQAASSAVPRRSGPCEAIKDSITVARVDSIANVVHGDVEVCSNSIQPDAGGTSAVVSGIF